MRTTNEVAPGLGAGGEGSVEAGLYPGADRIEVAHAVYRSFAQGDMLGVLNRMDPEIVWIGAEGHPYGGTYRGPEAVLHNVLVRLATEWEHFRAVPVEFLPSGDQVVVLGEYSGAYLATGRSFRARFAHVWRVRKGRILGFQQFADTYFIQQAVAR